MYHFAPFGRICNLNCCATSTLLNRPDTERVNMTELSKIFLTSGLTIFGAILVAVLGQVFTKAVLEPIQEQAKLVGEITHSLTYYRNVDLSLLSHYAGQLTKLRELEESSEARVLNEERIKRLIDQTFEKADSTSATLRGQAAKLRTTVRVIPKYDFWAKRGLVLTQEEVVAASTNLIGWSNSLHRSHHDSSAPDYAEIIAKALHVKL